MTFEKTINLTVDWVQVVRIINRYKDESPRNITMKLMEQESKLVNVSRRR